MKVDLHGIRFRLTITLTALACGSILLLGILQTGLIKPYYRNSKMKTVAVLAKKLTQDLLNPDDDNADNIRDAYEKTVDNNACVIILNTSGRTVYFADQLGEGCVFHSDVQTDTETKYYRYPSLMKMLDAQNTFFSDMTNLATGQKMVVYGERVQADLANYYLFINTPLEPVDSLISLFFKQYLSLMILIFVLASLLSVYLSLKIVKPIIDMQKQTAKLSKADYSVKFDGGSFSETKQLAQALNHATSELSQIEEMRRGLIANLSHDIKTPLTNIKAYAEMIRDISFDDPTKREKHLSVIIRETEYMNKLIHDMSELSKIQNGAYVLKKKNVDLVGLIHDVVLMHSALIDVHHLQVQLDLEDKLIVYADEVKMAEVIQNYLTNAIKHSKENGTIYIRGKTSDDGEVVKVEVEDRGEGIAEKDQKLIWDRYQKASGTFHRQIESTGLGLAIVKAILDAHRAEYGVISKVGEGSIFWFSLTETHHEI